MIKHTPETLQMVISGLECLRREAFGAGHIIDKLMPNQDAFKILKVGIDKIWALVGEYEDELARAKKRELKTGGKE